MECRGCPEGTRPQSKVVFTAARSASKAPPAFQTTRNPVRAIGRRQEFRGNCFQGTLRSGQESYAPFPPSSTGRTADVPRVPTAQRSDAPNLPAIRTDRRTDNPLTRAKPEVCPAPIRRAHHGPARPKSFSRAPAVCLMPPRFVERPVQKVPPRNPQSRRGPQPQSRTNRHGEKSPCAHARPSFVLKATNKCCR